MLTYVLLATVFIVVAMMWTEGMWTNAVTMINIIFAGILASNYFEPLAKHLEGQMASFTYVLDFLAFWLIFVLAFNVLRAATDQISKHKVRFRKPVENTGRIVFAVLAAWVMVCIICASLHIAPLGLSPFRGSFGKEPLANCFAGFSPDRYWWAFIHSRSKADAALASGQPRPFDPHGEFILKYGTRRKNLQEYNQKKDGKTRVEQADLR